MHAIEIINEKAFKQHHFCVAIEYQEAYFRKNLDFLAQAHRLTQNISGNNSDIEKRQLLVLVLLHII